MNKIIQKNQPNFEQSNHEKELISTNIFQHFFKLEFDSLNNFASQEMKKLQEEFASELLHSKDLLKKYENLRRLCDRKLEFDQFRLWSDHKNDRISHKHHHHIVDDFPMMRPSKMSHIPHKAIHYDESYDKYYDSQKSRTRKIPPPYAESRYNRMTRELPSSQRKGFIKRTYQDDLKRAEKYKTQNFHSMKDHRSSHHSKI